MSRKKKKKRWQRICGALLFALVVPLLSYGFFTLEIFYLQAGSASRSDNLKNSWLSEANDQARNIDAEDDGGNVRHNFQPLYITYFGIFIVFFGGCLLIPGLAETEIDLNSHVILDDDSNWLKWCLEIFFGKHSIFKNSYRGWIPIQSIFITNMILFCAVAIFVFMLVILKFTNLAHPRFPNVLVQILSLNKSGDIIGQELVKWTVGLLTLFFAVYFKLSTDYSSKWLYCANLYYKLFDYKLKGSDYDVARVALANDLLFLDLWNKRAFSTFFKSTLEEALAEFGSEEEKECYVFDSLKESEAEKILEKLLLSKKNSSLASAAS